MTPSTTAAAATGVIRSPLSGSKLESRFGRDPSRDNGRDYASISRIGIGTRDFTFQLPLAITGSTPGRRAAIPDLPYKLSTIEYYEGRLLLRLRPRPSHSPHRHISEESSIDLNQLLIF